MDIRPAATLALTRDTERGLEVLLLQRTWDAVFLPGFFVFPGGAVDAQDTDCRERMTGTSDSAISQTMSLDEGGADYMIAAIRECFEEAGVLLALDGQGQPLTSEHPLFAQDREALIRGQMTFAELCQDHNLTLPLDQLAYMSHWITPPGPPRRFDTRFFIAAAPRGQQARHDGAETIEHAWMTPQQALDDHRHGRRLLGTPTLRTLRVLSDFDSIDALLAYAHANPPDPFPSEPWPARRGDQGRMIEPGAPAYDEVRKLDPQGKGTASTVITPGTPVTIGPGVQRLTAPNPSMMTGPGTNSYVIGSDGDFVVIDPGPDNEAHIGRLLEITGGRISRVLVTHTHRDHSPGALRLREATGTLLVGMPAPDDPIQDQQFHADEVPSDGDTIPTPAGDLKVIHTPGHASNHLCYLLTRQNLLFSGDHIMQGSTVVINPPDGDMKAYIESLHRLLEEPIDYIAPGHGFLMGHAHPVVDYLVTHRLAREHKVAKALKALGSACLEDLTARAYDDVPAAIHGVAARSALAHLIKLEADGMVFLEGERWYWR